jgi:hypothetical protein
MSEAEWESAHVDLPPLDLPRRFNDCVTTAELQGHEDGLIGHYRTLVEIARAHGKASSLRPFPYFRTQPAIFAGDEMLTAFAWNDDMHETRAVLELLAASGSAPPRLLHDDQDQGWRILIAVTDTSTCFIEWDADGPPPATGGHAVEISELARQAEAALGRLRAVHGRLVQALGRDYWASPARNFPSPKASGLRSTLRRFVAAAWPPR